MEKLEFGVRKLGLYLNGLAIMSSRIRNYIVYQPTSAIGTLKKVGCIYL